MEGFSTKNKKLRKDYLYLTNPIKTSNRQKNLNKGLTGIVNFCNKHKISYSIRLKRKSFYFSLNGLVFRLANHYRRNNIRGVDDNSGKIYRFDFEYIDEKNIENILPIIYKELEDIISNMFKNLSYVNFFNYINDKGINVTNIDKTNKLKNFINEQKIKNKKDLKS